jgi:hypothetical protein
LSSAIPAPQRYAVALLGRYVCCFFVTILRLLAFGSE